MKLLTATTTGQGQRRNDYCWTVEGELVYLGLICGRDEREGPDGGCGCGRGFGGLNSHRATTTAMVRDVEDFTLAMYAEALRSYLEQAGWAELMEDAAGLALQEAAEMAELADRYPAGTILERRLEEVCERAMAS